jgi:hypothetical protein
MGCVYISPSPLSKIKRKNHFSLKTGSSGHVYSAKSGEAVLRFQGCNSNARVLVIMQHVLRLFLPVLWELRVLDDAEGVYPKILKGQGSSDGDSVLKSARRFLVWYATSPPLKSQRGRGHCWLLSLTMASMA